MLPPLYPFLTSTYVLPFLVIVAVLLPVLIIPWPTCAKSPPPYTLPKIREYPATNTTDVSVFPDILSVLSNCSVTVVDKFKLIIVDVLLNTVADSPSPPPKTLPSIKIFTSELLVSISVSSINTLVS